MTVDKALAYAGLVIAFIFCVSLITSYVAVLAVDTGAPLLGFAIAQAAAVSLIFICTTVVMVFYAYEVLSRQPDEVPLDNQGRGRMYREKMKGATVYQNTEAIPGPVMILEYSDGGQPRVRFEPQGLVPPGWQQILPMPEKLKVLEGSLRDSFERQRRDRYE
jgi:hypothetical protein